MNNADSWPSVETSAPIGFQFPAWFRDDFIRDELPDFGPLRWRGTSAADAALAVELTDAVSGRPLVPFASNDTYVFCFDGNDASAEPKILGAYQSSSRWGIFNSWDTRDAWLVEIHYERRQAELNHALSQPEPDLPFDRRQLSEMLAPPGFVFPQTYLAMLDDLPPLEPVWWLVESPQSLRSWGMIVSSQYPELPCTPFAKADNNDDVFCFDTERAPGDPPVLLVHSFAGPGWGSRGHWKNFDEFLAAARRSDETWDSDEWNGLQP